MQRKGAKKSNQIEYRENAYDEDENEIDLEGVCLKRRSSSIEEI